MSQTRYGDRYTRKATHCHTCGRPFEDVDIVVEHSGAAMVHKNGLETTDRGSIVMHPECATILAMRLISDVMDIRNSPEMRVVDTLRTVREAYQMK